MFLRRLADPIGPWKTDPILTTYRFTNAYRVNDRVSQYLIREVQYRPDRPSSPPELFFRTILFKLFNRIETWESLESRLGPLCWSNLDLNAVKAVLDERVARGHRLYSAAYIMSAPALGHARKQTNHLALLAHMMEHRLADRIRQTATLREIWQHEVGGFYVLELQCDEGLQSRKFLISFQSRFLETHYTAGSSM